MARPSDPRAAAARVRTPVAASRLNDDLETELAMGDPDPEWARRAEEARADLAGRFGGFDQLHEISTDRPVGTSERRHSGRRRPGSPKPAAKPAAKAPAGSPSTPPAAPGRAPGSRKPAPRTTRAPRRRGGGGRGAGQRVLQGTGISGAGRGATAFALQTLGLMLALALLYLVLNNAENAKRGGGLLDQSLSFLTGLVHRFVSPGDPLAPRSSASSGAAPARPRDETKSAGQGPELPASDVLRGRAGIGGFPRTTTVAPTTP